MRGDRRLTDIAEQLREKDRAVLRNISEGRDDVQKITSKTTLENHHVTYSFEKLEDLDLLEVEKPDGNVERVIDGQKRVFQHPKQAHLTEKGKGVVDDLGEDAGSRYSDLTHSEVVEKLGELENRVDDLESKMNVFKKQVQDVLK